MILDSTDKPWIIAILAISILGGVLYYPYAAAASSGPSGGTWPGLIYGIAGTGMMAFAGLLGARKKVLTLRIGRLQFWMRGHIWLGLLSLPMILFHGAFSLGGPLTTALMIVLIIIVLSGIFGLILQQFIPRLMMEEVPSEVIYEQADEFVRQMIEGVEQRIEAIKPKGDAEDTGGYAVVKDFYIKQVRPYLENPKSGGPFSRAPRTRLIFNHMVKLVPIQSHPVVDQLEKAVEQRRDLATQVRLHMILHSWTLVHVPLSAALLVLTVVHVIVALRYT